MRMSGKFLVLASMGLVATISMTGCGSEPQQNALPAGSTVVALGDSLTYGYGASTDTAYPEGTCRFESVESDKCRRQWRYIRRCAGSCR